MSRRPPQQQLQRQPRRTRAAAAAADGDGEEEEGGDHDDEARLEEAGRARADGGADDYNDADRVLRGIERVPDAAKGTANTRDSAATRSSSASSPRTATTELERSGGARVARAWFRWRGPR